MTLYGQCGYAHTLRHSVGYGILHQRLKSQRRHSHAQGILVTVPNHQQALSETVLLKPEVALNKIDQQVLGQGAVIATKRSYRVEGVEQKVGTDLRLQSP